MKKGKVKTYVIDNNGNLVSTTVNGEKVQAYDIYIEQVNTHGQIQEKSMVIKVTDPNLINRTGGIVQGMSGSPIVQNGKIVGAVTHVFVNDPTKGFGLYLDWMINLPWNNYTKDTDDLVKVKRILDSSHYGLEEVKDRILEYLAVKQNTNNLRSPIICLVGPPGVGKTTLAKSIANSLKKKFVKISVGGVHDEGEIVGHRRTYMGASPGKIIQGLKKVGVNNPVFLIDEVDKISTDLKNDPTSTLLDILDESQNHMFIDNYIEEPIDLSKPYKPFDNSDEYASYQDFLIEI